MKYKAIPLWKRKFYQSKEWKWLRAIAFTKSNGVCSRCNKLLTEKYSTHHTIELNENNYTNTNISLNLELLEVLCESCHNNHHDKFKVNSEESFYDKDSNLIDYSAREAKINTPLIKKRK